jgi:hypothetical protein
MTPITEESLINAGYEKEIFFFQTGGGEDEDDQDIYVKGDIAVTYESTYKCWYTQKRDRLNYVDGFEIEDATVVEFIEDIIIE